MTERHQRADARRERCEIARQMEYLHRRGLVSVHNKDGQRTYTIRPECVITDEQCECGGTVRYRGRAARYDGAGNRREARHAGDHGSLLRRGDVGLWVEQAARPLVGWMSGNPILTRTGVIGVFATSQGVRGEDAGHREGGPQAYMPAALPGWMLES